MANNESPRSFPVGYSIERTSGFIMNTKHVRAYRDFLILLAAVILICVLYGAVSVSRFNQTPHTSIGFTETDPTTMDIHFRGGDTSSWIKSAAHLHGNVFDAIIRNDAKDMVSTWTLRVNIQGDCYLNQFWNGDVEIHQHVASGEEKVQTLNLAKYDLEAIELDYIIDASDLLLPLEAGDYFIYYPSAAFREMPLDSGDEAIVGMIVYYRSKIDLSDYQIDFFYQMDMTREPLFYVICALTGLWVLLFGICVSMNYAYRKAQKEMELKKSGISCMAELYAVIYIIDLVANTIIPVGMSEEQDQNRPKTSQLTSS